MDKQREKLIELIEEAENICQNKDPVECATCEYARKPYPCTNGLIADHLLANGVVVPPCPIGTKIYMLVTKRPKANFPEFTFIKDSKLTFLNLERVIAQFGKTVFLSREDAEKALKGVE